MSSPVSDPHAELRLSLPSNSLSEGRRGGGVLRTYGEAASGRLRLEIEPAAAISRSGSLTNGTCVAKVQLETMELVFLNVLKGLLNIIML